MARCSIWWLKRKGRKCEAYEPHFKPLADKIEGIKLKLAEIGADEAEGQQSRQRLTETEKILGSEAFTIQNYDDGLVRKLVDRIYVVSKEQIRIVFKGGFEVEQEMV